MPGSMARTVVMACTAVVALAEPEDCAPSEPVMENIVSATTDFANCVVNWTSPVRFCQFCKTQHEDYKTAFNALPGNCQQFGAYQAFQGSFEALWLDSACDDCTADTIGSLQMALTDLRDCLDSMNHSSTLCQTCKPFFKNIMNLYNSAPSPCHDTVDVIDAYRRSLSVWANHRCPVPIPGKEPVTIILALVLGWVFVFYGLSRAFVKMPAQFFFGFAAKPVEKEQRFEDAPDPTCHYFEHTGPGLKSMDMLSDFDNGHSPPRGNSSPVAGGLQIRKRSYSDVGWAARRDGTDK
eukprot:m.33644 g.33644  ORF g.33644 m.33644 type:complete len:294 (+) comp5038_c0_seq1:95-976(+)